MGRIKRFIGLEEDPVDTDERQDLEPEVDDPEVEPEVEEPEVEELEAPVDPGPFLQTLARGSAGDEVARWQRALGLRPSGHFDSSTEEATRALQAEKGLRETGRTDIATWRALRKRLRGV